MALLVRKGNPNSYFRRLTRLKKLFWLYFLLLIFEGALRKWVAPALSAPLLVIRDPVGILIIWEAYRTHKWPSRWSVALTLLTVLLIGLFAVQLIAGRNLLIELFGLRSYLLPFPVLFIMGENLDEEDLRKMIAFTLWLIVPMTLLEVAQYVATPNSFLNRGAYEGGGQIKYLNGHVRASGTFSSTIGAVEFLILTGAFVLYGTIKEGLAKKWLLWADTFALVLSIPMLGSRGTVFQLMILLGCVALSGIMGIAQFVKTFRIVLPVAIILFLVTQLPVFSSAMANLSQRFNGAAQIGQTRQSTGYEAADTVYQRLVTPVIASIENSNSSRTWSGIGIGRGAVAVNAMLTRSGNTLNPFGQNENTTARELLEMGLAAGFPFEFFKLFLAIVIFGQALARAREQEPLTLLLVPMGVVWMFFAQLEQPTEQGFVVIGTAFCIAAARVLAAKRAPRLVQRPRPPQYRRRVQRG